MVATHTSTCRACVNMCPTVVEVVDGRLVSVAGDRDNPVFRGYTCVKGRSQPYYHNHPDRLLTPRKRLPDGRYLPISSETAMDEIAERLQAIVADHGPRAVASYFGSMIITNPLTQPVQLAFMQALGSPLTFHPGTLDKPGKPIAAALLGAWQAPLQGYDRADVALLIGLNPAQSHYGVPCGAPSTWLGERLRAGMQLIVIDPRETELARRATLHLQPMPGHDVAILAAMIRVVLVEGLGDREFVDRYVGGVEELRAAVDPFTPAVVGRWAGIPADRIVEAARIFATAGRGYAAAGVGPGFADSSTLVEYLVLVLETLCGHWLRAGERVERAPTLVAAPRYVAQPSGPRPAYGFGVRMRATGLGATAAGLPTGVLADEMLLDGEDRVRALISCGGNPVSAWPDQQKVIEALDRLDLLVQIDPWMSATARLADYVLAPKMFYEVASATFPTDMMMLMPTWYGPERSYAQYTPAVAEPPAGADVIEEWEFFHGLARRMGLQLHLSAMFAAEVEPWRIDLEHKPTSEELIEVLAAGGRVPLDEVKRHPHGAVFPEPAVYVEEPDPGVTHRMQVAHQQMVRHLGEVWDREVRAAATGGGPRPDGSGFRLVHRRVQHTYNSTGVEPAPPALRHPRFNPAHLHPEDLAMLGLRDGDEIVVRSARAGIPAVVRADPTLRRGLVGMAHGFGGAPERDSEYPRIGACTGRLLDAADLADPYVGMPRIGNVEVTIIRRKRPRVR